MKRKRNIASIIFLFIGLCVVSCEKDHEEIVEPVAVVEHYVSQDPGVIHVSMEGSFNPSTKVCVMGPDYSGETYWTPGDQIAYCVTNGSSAQYNIATVDIDNETILPEIASGYYRANYAITPAASRGTDFTTPTVVYPTSYDLEKDIDNSDPDEEYSLVPMVATNTGSSMAFYHVGSLLRLHLTNVNTSTTKVTVRFDGITDVTGTYAVSNAGTASASTSLSTGGGNIVTFTSVGVDYRKETFLNIPIPSGNYSSLTSLTVRTYDSANTLLQSTQHFLSLTSIARAHAKVVEMSMREYRTFAGLMITPAPLYYNGTNFVIKDEDWNHDSYNSVYGKNNGSYYFSFVELGKYFDADGESFGTSSGDIDNTNKISFDGYNDWRLPTRTEWAAITTGSRTGSSVNGTDGCRYAVIRLTGISLYGSSIPSGLLLFPDGATMTGMSRTFTYNVNSMSGNENVTVSELNEYINAGCVFLPGAGYYNRSVLRWYNSGGYYWAATAAANGTNGYKLVILATSVNPNSGDNKSTSYSPVRLVR